MTPLSQPSQAGRKYLPRSPRWRRTNRRWGFCQPVRLWDLRSPACRPGLAGRRSRTGL